MKNPCHCIAFMPWNHQSSLRSGEIRRATLLYSVAGSGQRFAETNITLRFPELYPAAQAQGKGACSL